MNLLDLILYQNKRNAASIRRPRWILVISVVAGELSHVGAIHRSAHKLFSAGDHHDVDHFFPVRRKRGIHDGGMAELICQSTRAALR